MPKIIFDYTPSYNYIEPPKEPPEDYWDEEVDDIDERFDRFLGGTQSWRKLIDMKHFKPYKLRSLFDAPTNGRGWSYTKKSQDNSQKDTQK